MKRNFQFQTPPSTNAPNTQDPPAIPTPVNACLNDNDVIFVLDSSGSVGASYYKKGKVFAYDLARAFANRPTSRFGFTIFSSSVRTIAPLDNNLSAADLNTAILNADFMAGQTFTNLAIDSAVAEFAASTRSVTKNLVILTDGASNVPSATLTSIGNAINQGIRTFAVGVGPSTSQKELLALAGGNKDRLFTASSFDELTSLLNPLKQVICNQDTCHLDININTLLNNDQKLKLVQLLLCTCKR